MSIGYRRQGDNGPLYHPERDYAYITPTLMRQAIENLETTPTEEMKRWREEHTITTEEILKAATALANAQRHFVSCADPVTTLEQALNREEWQTIRHAVKQYVMASIGEVIVGAWFNAVREVTNVGEESPAKNEMCRFSSAVREFCRRQGVPVADSSSTADVLLFQNDILLGRIKAANAMIQQLKQETYDLKNKLVESEKKTGRVKWLRWFCEPTTYCGPK